MSNACKRFLSMALALVMVLSMVPSFGHVHVHAEETEPETTATEAATEAAAEAAVEPAAEAPTEAATEAPTEAATEAPAEEATEAAAEPVATTSEAYAAIQYKIDDMLTWYLGTTDATEVEIAAAVAAMTTDDVWMAQVEVQDILTEAEATLTEAEITVLAEDNEVFAAFVNELSKYPAAPNMLAVLNGVNVTDLGVEYTNAGSNRSSWTAGSDGKSITGTATGYKSMGIFNLSATTTLTLTNNKSTEAELTFSYTLTGGGSVEASTGTMANGAYTGTLATGASVTITLTSPSGSGTNTLSITDLSLLSTSTADVNTTFAVAENGSYTVNGTAVTADTVEAGPVGTEYALVATPASGYKFVGWYDETHTTYFDTNTTCTAMFDGDSTVYPVFVTTDTAIFMVGSGNYFFDLDDAVTYAVANSQTQITLVSSGTISDASYEIPSGYTLLIACSTDYTPKGEKPATVGATSWTTPSAYATLTMASGTTLTVNGTLEVAGTLRYCSGGNHFGNTTYGEYGAIYMNANSHIVVNSKLYTWGYIYGSGHVTANSGASVYEPMQINDFYGGSNLGDMANMFPFSQYYVQNIEVPLTLNSGANEYVYAKLVISSYQLPAVVPFIGSNNDAMFKIESGTSVTKTYNPVTDRLIIDINGNAALQSVSLEPDLSDFSTDQKIAITAILSGMLGGTTINSAKYILCLNGNITINVNSGMTTISQEMSALPGVEMYIDNGATVTIAEGDSADTTVSGGSAGKNVYIFDFEQWGNYIFSGRQLTPAAYSPTAGRYTRTADDLKDVIVDINGTVIANGYLYSTVNYEYEFDADGNLLSLTIIGGGAQIESSGKTGKIVMQNGAGTEMGVYNLDGTGATETTIFVASAQLQNGDGTYVNTAGAAAGTTFYYCATCDKWVEGVTVTFDANGGSNTMNPQIIENPCCGENLTANAFTNGDKEFDGWNNAADGTGETSYADGAKFTGTESVTLYAQWADAKPTYTINWEVNGTVVETDTVKEGSYPEFDGDVPTKAGDAQYVSYTFAGWDVNGDGKYDTTNDIIPAATANATYKAVFTPGAVKTYDVVFYDADGTTVLYTAEKVPYGKVPSYEGAMNKTVDCTTYTISIPTVTAVDGTAATLSYTLSWIEGETKHTPNKDDGNCTTAVTCSVCGDVTTPAKAHTPGVDATCTTAQTCTECGMTLNEATGHQNTVTINKKTETCTDNGYTGDTYCNDCKTTIHFGTVITAQGHSAGSDDGDCTTPIPCTKCGEDAVAAKTHVDSDDNNHVCDNAGCTVDNVTAHTPNADDGNCTTPILCTECDAVTTAAKTHSYTNACDIDCNNDGCTVTREITHSPNADDGNCTTAVTCSVCGTVTTPAKDAHIGGTAYCNAYAVCDTCGKEYGAYDSNNHVGDNISPADHYCDGCATKLTACDSNVKVVDSEPICTESGLIFYYCSVCGAKDTSKTEYPEALGHVDADPKDHYCDRDGCDAWIGDHSDTGDDKDHVCDYGCGAVLEECYDNPGDGDHNCTVCNAPNITACTPADDDGNCTTAIKCTECDEVTTAAKAHFDSNDDSDHDCDNCDVKNIEDHTPGADATCETAQTCTECGETLNAATGHAWGEATYTWADDYSFCTATRVCQTDATHVETATTTNINGNEITSATCTADGEMQYTATFDEVWATDDVTVAIPATGHSFTTYTPYYPADCTTNRKDIAECDNGCGTTDIVEVPNSALGHGWKGYTYSDNNDGTHDVNCAHCFAVTEEDVYHTYTDGVCVCDARETFYVNWWIASENVGMTPVKFGDPIPALDISAPSNYYGYEWETEIPATMPAENITIEGYWTVKLTVLNPDGEEVGIIGDDGICKVGESVYVNYNGTYYKEGHTFWLVDQTTSAKYTLTYQSGMPYWPTVTVTENTTLKATFEPNTYTLTVQVLATGEEVTLTVTYGANLLEVLAQAATDEKIPAIDEMIRVNVADFNGERRVSGYSYSADEGWIGISEYDTMPAGNLEIDQDFTNIGWVVWDGTAYHTADGEYLRGWQYIEEDYDDVEGGAWYYFDPDTTFRAEGIARAPYPTVEIDGNTYETDAETLAYCKSKGVEFIDADEAWFIFGTDGKFQYNETGMGTYLEATRYAVNGMLTWHPGLVEVEGDYYYFIGDETNGGNIMATGDVFLLRNRTDRETVTSGIYTFGTDGKLCEYDGITDMANGTKRYYKDAQLMTGAGLVQVGDNYIYVRSNGELVVDAEYWVPANSLGITEGMYQFDANGYMIIPEADPVKNGIYAENDGWFYYVDGVKDYNAGLIKLTEDTNWYNADGEAVMTESSCYIYVRSNGQLATGTYYVTNLENYTGSDVQSGDKVQFNDYGLMQVGKDGIVAENGSLYYYENNQIVYGAGLIELDGSYYYVKSNGEVVNNRSYWITNVNETGVVAKTYEFDENGVLQNPEFSLKNGIIEGYYYVDGELAYCAGLIEIEEGVYIYVRSNGALATGLYWPTNTNGLLPTGQYDFGTDGYYYAN